jgi:hypothetical protein
VRVKTRKEIPAALQGFTKEEPMMTRIRRLGTTDLEIKILGFGAWEAA